MSGDGLRDEIAARVEAAVSVTGDGPLELRIGHSNDLDRMTYDVFSDGHWVASCTAEETAELLIHAATDIQALQAHIVAAREQVAGEFAYIWTDYPKALDLLKETEADRDAAVARAEAAEQAVQRVRVGSALVVRDEQGRILLGLRDKEPNRGRWVLPGGKIEPFESIAAAARRELLEETGLDVAVEDQIGVFEIINPPNEHRLVVYSWARPLGEVRSAASDLADLRYVTPHEAARLDLTEICRDVLQAVRWLPTALDGTG